MASTSIVGGPDTIGVCPALGCSLCVSFTLFTCCDLLELLVTTLSLRELILKPPHGPVLSASEAKDCLQ
ncbi:hypothetical protein F2Q70_00023828 [Brassica cretica]|uniref:Uncharacterized protein n=1 Tax=Brassica cretica TaxID=69181 RepID=A0A8S9GHT0_BRACR|nr:hypothetical protein F2Q70_00023828 [Brassica cretica]